ncbi:hypothetical protein HYZ97_00655 [Candidatus Pacearchaeota archaeon]|nr:hypothetical protein [Candidatus Pacearchaeota archaeon]
MASDIIKAYRTNKEMSPRQVLTALNVLCEAGVSVTRPSENGTNIIEKLFARGKVHTPSEAHIPFIHSLEVFPQVSIDYLPLLLEVEAHDKDTQLLTLQYTTQGASILVDRRGLKNGKRVLFRYSIQNRPLSDDTSRFLFQYHFGSFALAR